MTARTDASEQSVLDWEFTASAVTRPTEWWVALHTADPTETGSTGEITGAGGYARQSVSFTRTGSLAENTALLTFGPCTGSGWGTITHASIWTAVTGGTCLRKGALTSSVSIGLFDSLTIAAGALDLTED